jgi:hypothetical protein
MDRSLQIQKVAEKRGFLVGIRGLLLILFGEPLFVYKN